MILDEMLPHGDVSIDESAVIAADPATTFAAVRDLDLLTVRTPLLTASMWVRGLPDQVRGRASEVPERLTLGGDGGTGLPGWLLLGESDSEICLGAVGRFWTPNIEWRPTALEEFAAFAEPDWGKIATSLSVLPYGAEHAVLTYECRTATYDDHSRRAFARYWRVIRPFVAHIMRATVTTVRTNATTMVPV